MPDTPAARDIQAFLRGHRPRLPPLLRAALATGLALTAAYVALLAVFFVTDRALFQDLLRLTLLTIVAGREPAMLAVYQNPTPAPLGWTLLVAVLDDVGTLLLCLVGWWWVYEALRGGRRLGAWLAEVEKEALRHQAWLRRWGLVGLAAFYWLPGLGTGNVAISAMGVVARIPLRLLLPTLVASIVAVNVFWAVALRATALALPSEGPWEWLPLGTVATVLAVAAASRLLRRRTRHLFLLPTPQDGRGERLAQPGFRARGTVVEVDSRALASHAGLGNQELGRLHNLAELLLATGMGLPAAKALEERGVAGARYLAALPPRLVRAALEEAGVAAPPEPTLASWGEAAQRWRLGLPSPA